MQMKEEIGNGLRGFNTILYCKRFKECVVFYRDLLGFEVHCSKPWFVEFKVGRQSYLSIADENSASVQTAGGDGITLSFRVDDAGKFRLNLCSRLDEVEPLRVHPWGGHSFFIYDPEGSRIEFWSQ